MATTRGSSAASAAVKVSPAMKEPRGGAVKRARNAPVVDESPASIAAERQPYEMGFTSFAGCYLFESNLAGPLADAVLTGEPQRVIPGSDMTELQFGRLTHDEQKKQRRLIRNRLSAHQHRQRQRAHVDALETQVMELCVVVDELRARLLEATAAPCPCVGTGPGARVHVPPALLTYVPPHVPGLLGHTGSGDGEMSRVAVSAIRAAVLTGLLGPSGVAASAAGLLASAAGAARLTQLGLSAEGVELGASSVREVLGLRAGGSERTAAIPLPAPPAADGAASRRATGRSRTVAAPGSVSSSSSTLAASTSSAPTSRTRGGTRSGTTSLSMPLISMAEVLAGRPGQEGCDATTASFIGSSVLSHESSGSERGSSPLVDEVMDGAGDAYAYGPGLGLLLPLDLEEEQGLEGLAEELGGGKRARVGSFDAPSYRPLSLSAMSGTSLGLDDIGIMEGASECVLSEGTGVVGAGAGADGAGRRAWACASPALLLPLLGALAVLGGTGGMGRHPEAWSEPSSPLLMSPQPPSFARRLAAALPWVAAPPSRLNRALDLLESAAAGAGVPMSVEAPPYVTPTAVVEKEEEEREGEEEEGGATLRVPTPFTTRGVSLRASSPLNDTALPLVLTTATLNLPLSLTRVAAAGARMGHALAKLIALSESKSGGEGKESEALARALRSYAEAARRAYISSVKALGGEERAWEGPDGPPLLRPASFVVCPDPLASLAGLTPWHAGGRGRGAGAQRAHRAETGSPLLPATRLIAASSVGAGPARTPPVRLALPPAEESGAAEDGSAGAPSRPFLLLMVPGDTAGGIRTPGTGAASPRVDVTVAEGGPTHTGAAGGRPSPPANASAGGWLEVGCEVVSLRRVAGLELRGEGASPPPAGSQ
jgi:hypothetical protein